MTKFVCSECDRPYDHYHVKADGKVITYDEEVEKTIERQRIAIDTLLKAIQAHFDTGCNQPLKDAYLAVSSASTMTGTEER
jgi:hypothetical protein